MLVSLTLLAWGSANVFVGTLVLTGVISPTSHPNEWVLRWHVFVWDLWFAVSGAALAIAIMGYRRARYGSGTGGGRRPSGPKRAALWSPNATGLASAALCKMRVATHSGRVCGARRWSSTRPAKEDQMITGAVDPAPNYVELPETRATQTRLLVVDDHAAVRAGLRDLLKDEGDFDVVAAVASAEAAMSIAEREPIDVAVVDYQLGRRNGLWVSRKLKRLPSPPAVLIYSAYADGVLAAAAVVAQADGIVSKGGLGSELCDQIRRVARGHSGMRPMPAWLGDTIRSRFGHQEQAVFGMCSPASIRARSPRRWVSLRQVWSPVCGQCSTHSRLLTPSTGSRTSPVMRRDCMSSLPQPSTSIKRTGLMRRRPSRRRRYIPLLRRVAGLNVLLVLAAVVITVVVLAPRKISSFAVDEEIVVLVAAVGLVVLANVYLLRRVVGPVQALTALARRVDLTSPGQRISAAQPTSEAGELAVTFKTRCSSGSRPSDGRPPGGCSPRRRQNACGSPKSSTTKSVNS